MKRIHTTVTQQVAQRSLLNYIDVLRETKNQKNILEKEIKYFYKDKEFTSKAVKTRDSYYTITEGENAGKEIHIMKLIH